MTTEWSVVTIVSLVIATIPGAVYFLSITFGGQGAVDIERFLERVITGTPLYVIAGYAAIQGARARENERKARAKDLELAAVGPYLASLEDAQRNAMTMVLAPRYFGESSSGPVGNEGIAAGEIIKAIEDAGKRS